MVFEANSRNKKEPTLWKDMENCAKKCVFLCTILIEVNWEFWKMWCGVSAQKALQGSKAVTTEILGGMEEKWKQ